MYPTSSYKGSNFFCNADFVYSDFAFLTHWSRLNLGCYVQQQYKQQVTHVASDLANDLASYPEQMGEGGGIAQPMLSVHLLVKV